LCAKLKFAVSSALFVKCFLLHLPILSSRGLR
jgi:hypothetical protein